MSLDFTKHIEYLPGEEWRWVVNFENRYAVSNKGRVFSVCSNWGTRKKMLKMRVSTSGYLQVGLSKGDGKRSGRGKSYVHRLVATAFLKNREGFPQVNHKDGNKINNTTENLEWVTARQNVLHSMDALGNRFADWQSQSLKKEDVRSIVSEYYSTDIKQKDLGAKYGVGQTTIYQIVRGKTWQWATGISWTKKPHRGKKIGLNHQYLAKDKAV